MKAEAKQNWIVLRLEDLVHTVAFQKTQLLNLHN